MISEMSRRMIGGPRTASLLDAQMSVAYALAGSSSAAAST